MDCHAMIEKYEEYLYMLMENLKCEYFSWQKKNTEECLVAILEISCN